MAKRSDDAKGELCEAGKPSGMEQKENAKPTSATRDGVRRLLVKQYNTVYALTERDDPAAEAYLAKLAKALDS